MNTLTPRMTRTMFIAGIAMMIMSLLLSMFNVATVLSAPRHALSPVPNEIGYEGYLAENGQSLNGTYSIRFSIFDSGPNGGGNLLWSQEIGNVTVTNGLYSVVLGPGASTPIADVFSSVGNGAGARWIQVERGNNLYLPRTRVSSVPFALNAENANQVRGATGMIALFDTECPTGWSPYTAAQGRTVVGAPPTGPFGATATKGNALTNLEDRAFPSHQHKTGFGFWESQWMYTRPGLYGTSGDLLPPNAGDPSPTKKLWWNIGGTDIGVRTTSNAPEWLTSAESAGKTADIVPYIQLMYCKLSP